jgi:hypothetical protein
MADDQTPNKPRVTTKTSIAFPPDLLEAVKRAAGKRQVSTSRVVRDALLRYPAVKRELVA